MLANIREEAMAKDVQLAIQHSWTQWVNVTLLPPLLLVEYSDVEFTAHTLQKKANDLQQANHVSVSRPTSTSSSNSTAAMST